MQFLQTTLHLRPSMTSSNHLSLPYQYSCLSVFVMKWPLVIIFPKCYTISFQESYSVQRKSLPFTWSFPFPPILYLSLSLSLSLFLSLSLLIQSQLWKMMLTQRINVLAHDLATQCHVTPVRVDPVRSKETGVIKRELERRVSMEEAARTPGEG